jgi:mono/diheme cytochrome c family protein
MRKRERCEFTRPVVALAASLFLNTGTATARTAAVARGEYLAAAGDCVVCHTSNGGPRFAGGYPLHAVFGTVFSTNITPDTLTGIGNWTADDLYRALHDGIGANQQRLYPAFPYPYFTHISRADSDALYAYLMSLTAVRYTPPPATLFFPANIRTLMLFWNFLFLSKGPLQPNQARSELWNRGAQIVNGVAHCGGCHTPKNLFFADKADRAFQGDVVDGWFAPNLTGSNSDGLGSWSMADLIQYLRTGKNRFSSVAGSMQAVVSDSTSRLSDADLGAIATYLKALPQAPEPVRTQPSVHAMTGGENIFTQRCAFCHQDGSDSASSDYPRLAGNTLVVARDATTVLRVILDGSQSAAVRGAPVGYSMPAFPVLSNEELAEVATYIRNAWGNKAAPVSAAQAAAVVQRNQ